MAEEELMILVGSQQGKVKSQLQRISEGPHADTLL